MTFAEHFLHSGTLFSVSPDKVIIGWGKRLKSDSPTSKGIPSFYFPDFFLTDQTPWCSYETWGEFHLDDLIKKLESLQLNKSFESLNWSHFSKEVFKTNFDVLKNLLISGALVKGVPYIFEVAKSKMTPERLKASLLKLLQTIKHKPMHGYGFWEDGQGILGATPEILFRSSCPNNLILETMACAGTEKTDTPNSIRLKSPKERHEHALVIQGVQDSIESLGGTLKVHETKLLKLPLLNHLVTPLTVTFPEKISFDLIVKALHPTPALGAIPRAEGMRWLDQLQKNLPRRRYGAPIAIIDAHGTQTTCAVAIRNVQWQDEWMSIGAGCGVVLESDFEQEWDELHLKIASIKEILAL
ncbi:MAG: chorismate-binding protein [Parachlamydiaceae bacterium]|nr:chorismate-binding protein [Parachlamydiaceae bacterium]